MEPLVEYIYTRTELSLRGSAKPAKFRASLEDDSNQEAIKTFLSEPTCQALFWNFQKGDVLQASNVCDSKPLVKKKSLVFLKPSEFECTSETLQDDVMCLEYTNNALENLSVMSQKVYDPMLRNMPPIENMAKPTRDSVGRKFNGFLSEMAIACGKADGKTVLPFPSEEFFTSDRSKDKDLAYEVEQLIAGWTRQINEVLNIDIGIAIFSEDEEADPLAEMAFWKSYSENLESLLGQLTHDDMRKVIRVLKKSKSPTLLSFKNTVIAVSDARYRATDNFIRMKHLECYLLSIREALEFTSIVEHFAPLMYTMTLVWQDSEAYCTPERLTVFMQGLCNAVISQASRYVDGEAIMRQVDDDNHVEAIGMINTALGICDRFRRTFSKYKKRSFEMFADDENRQWTASPDIMFHRLTVYEKRCRDILGFVNLLADYSKLEKIFIGGTKGAKLTDMVQHIHSSFNELVEQFKGKTPDLMDIRNKNFEDDMFRFRMKIKELERRLAALFTAAFDDCATLNARFQLLDTFEDLLNRPILRDEVDKHQIDLLREYMRDLQIVRAMFDRDNADPPIHRNQPPLAGALRWSKGLLMRISEPMERLNVFLAEMTHNAQAQTEFDEIKRFFDAVCRDLNRYEVMLVDKWNKEIDDNSQMSLDKPLLRRDPRHDEEDNSPDQDGEKPLALRRGRLHVNFDDAIVRLLREAKYFSEMKVEVPPKAAVIYEKVDMYRRQIASMQIMSDMYNRVVGSLNDVEYPLLQGRIDEIDTVLRPGLDKLTWCSSGVDAFVEQCLKSMRDIYKIFNVMKNNLKKIRSLLKDLAELPAIERKAKAHPPQEFEENVQKLHSARVAELQKIDKTIAKQIAEINSQVKISTDDDRWKAFLKFAQSEIVSGAALSVNSAIDALVEQMESTDPFLEIQLALDQSQGIRFNASDSRPENIWHILEGWVNTFFEIGTALTPLIDDDDFAGEVTGDAKERSEDSALGSEDSKAASSDDADAKWAAEGGSDAKGSDDTESAAPASRFVQALRQRSDINERLSKLRALSEQSKQKCNDFRKSYDKFEFLFATSREESFNEFLRSKGKAEEDKGDAKAKKPKAKAEEKKDDAESKSEGEVEKKEKIDPPPLADFDAKITEYKELKTEIQKRENEVTIDWLKINTKPLKSNLATWASKWVFTYTSYLVDDITQSLTSLDGFMTEVDAGLEQEVPEGDSEKLQAVLGHIHKVRSRNDETVTMFGPLRNSVVLLKRHEVMVDEKQIALLEEAPLRWETTINRVYKVKEKINPLQNKEVDNIKKRVWAFGDEVTEFRQTYKDEAPYQYGMTPEQAYVSIEKFHTLIDGLEEHAAALRNLENLYELSVSNYGALKECRSQNHLLKQLWDMIKTVQGVFQSWRSTPWDKIDTDALMLETKRLQKNVSSLPKELRARGAYTGLQDDVKNYQTIFPLVNLLHSPSMQERHWKELMSITGKHFTMGADFSLSDLLDLELHKFVSDVEETVELSSKEAKIGTALKKIAETWTGDNAHMLEFGKHEATGVTLIHATEEVLVSLEENMSELQYMAGQGRYVEHFLTEVSEWQSKLGTTESVLTDWLDVQGKWSSLQSIFLGSEDIRVQLPKESAQFDGIDEKWRNLMQEAAEIPRVIDNCTAESRSTLLEGMKAGLEECEKALNQYLETKKMAFPRFYFLSNTSLLDLLSNGNNPQAVQSHLADCFDNIKKLEFQKDEEGKPTKNAIGMYSKDGDEYVPFHEPFSCEGAVEDWLNGVVDMMRNTLKDILEKARFTAEQWEIEKAREEWMMDYCAQIALSASQIIWTEEVVSQFDALEDGNEQAMREYFKVVNDRLSKEILLVLGELTPEVRVKVITLITVDVHNRDVVSMLIQNKIARASEFAWKSQMRYVWRPEEKIVNVQVADAKFDYAYEYIGNTGRLVITPLTDRCYITLTQALNLFMGGAPAGPAGTGKTETTKDLGRALGLPVYVFNCSEQMNVHSLGAIFKGLCQAGAWGCFDEFNRIPIEVLSVVATMFSSILVALRAGKTKFNFMGEDIRLQKEIGAFITMNPGYAGRTELPENLKALFRSCAMVVPDMEMICENMLMSEGFLSAKHLALKFVTLYSLSKELLSKQAHYDWGLRATKAVLRVAGGLKRAEPDVSEDKVLLRALRDFNLPKIVLEDQPIFTRLISDLFMGIEVDRKIDADLVEVSKVVTREMGLQAEDMFIQKVTDCADLLVVRHSIFIIGPPSAAKSCVWRVLANAFNRSDKKTVFEALNPKAVRNDELYGWLKGADWSDGILSTIMRNMCKCNAPFTEQQKMKWMVLDGDIDPEWIESLNTVMDDNKVLTLVSNERIPLTPSMRLIFEISSLKNATPATVSRAGILFINAADVGWKPMIDSWIEAREDEQERSTLLALFNKYITQDNMDLIRKSFKYIVPVADISKLRSLCNILEGMLPELKPYRGKHDAAVERMMFETTFVIACVWALGGALLSDKQNDSKNEFSAWWKHTFQTVKYPLDADVEGSNTVFDYYFDLEKQELARWVTKVPEFIPPRGELLVNTLMVSTADTVRQTFFLDLLVRKRKPVLFVGNAGTGKTTLVKEFLRKLDPTKFLSATVNLNFYTDASTLMNILEQSVDKRSGRTYGPPGSKNMIYYVDDLNMPCLDTYGTQSPIALIRQHMDYVGWWDPIKLERKEIQDCQYVASMNPTAGSFVVNDRLMGHFTVFSSTVPEDDDLALIYSSILRGHLELFDDPVRDLAEPITNATIDLLHTMSEKFLPSTIKFHYQFNLRDMSNVFQGLVQSRPGTLTPLEFGRLWIHECTRVFSDRLITDDDLNLFQEVLQEKTNSHLKELDKAAIQEQPNLFTSFVGQTDDDNPVYKPCPSPEALKESMEAHLNDYNENNAQMDLVLFGIAMEHVVRIARIIRNPRGNAMLVGVGGSGKQSLTRLASFICGYEIFQIQVTRSYSSSDLLEDIRGLYRKTGIKNVPITFLITDSHIVDEKWLVFINDLLSSGNIQGLFEDDEKEGILSGLRSQAKEAGCNVDDKDEMNEFFLNRVRANLHVVLCFSPVGDTLRVRCRKFPGLINSTSIDWFFPWPRDALISVAQRFLGDVELESDELRNNISLHMAEVHLSVNAASERYLALERRYNYTTPKSYLELIGFYKSLLGVKTEELDKQISRLEKGVATLQKTQTDVNQLKQDLLRQLEVVAQKSEMASKLIEEAGKERAKVEEQQALAEIEKEKSSEIAAKANAIKDECDRDLAAATPAMEAAKAAVDCLDKQSLTQLKSFKKPDEKILQVTKGVLILKNNERKDFSWKNAMSMMKSIDGFLGELQTFDARTVTDETVNALKPILSLEYFTYETMNKISSAAANLANWVINTVSYNGIYKNVAPKMAKQAAAQAEYDAAMEKLEVVKKQVAEMEAALQEVTNKLEGAVAEKSKVEADAEACKNRLTLAERLVNGLSSENERWGTGVLNLKEKARTLVGDVLLAAAFVSYIGAFNQKFRTELWQGFWVPDLNKKEIPLTPEITPVKVLATDSDFARWANEGLPADSISRENGAIVTRCSRWPLMIDPQLQGIGWIRQREPDLKIVRMDQARWVNVIVNAVRNGEVVMIEGVTESIDSVLDPILSRSFTKRGRSLFITIAGEEISYDEKFRLFLQTKLSNPHYKPEIAAQCTLINFIVTEEGLEEQLLAHVVNKEKPELEEQRSALVRAINEYMVTLNELENVLLEKLSNAPDDILSDISLIESLEDTKKTSTEIAEKVEQAKVQEISINKARNAYRTVAMESSWIYFGLLDLNTIDHMYQYSLEAFSQFFFKGIATAEPSEELERRIVILRNSIRLTVFQWVARGLFEKDKLIFCSHIAFKLMQKGSLAQKMNPEMFQFLIRNEIKFGAENPIEWLPEASWNALQKMAEIEGLEKFVKDLAASANRFKEWYQKARPESTPLPLDWRKLDENDPFAKLLIVKCMRPDRITVAVEDFVRGALPDGRAYTELDSTNSFTDVLNDSLGDASPTTPMFFILSPGADPIQTVVAIANKAGHGDKVFRVALGQGQEKIALNRLANGVKEGHWVVLENIHLMPRWCNELEKELNQVASDGTANPDFRLFLSAEPAAGIPIGLLERSIKITNEPPQGLKANLKRAFASFDREEFEFKDNKVKAILFVLCHFHAVILERKKYGPKGWNCVYPFNTGDLTDSSTILSAYMENSDVVPWADLRYIFGEIMYGGHITDDWDRLLCRSYLEFYMTEAMFDGVELYPYISETAGDQTFKSPPVIEYPEYFTYIDQELPSESPVAVGLHPNSEIAVRTEQSDGLRMTVQELQPRQASSSGGGMSPQARAAQVLEGIMEKMEDVFIDIEEIAASLSEDERGPFQNVFLQECDRMNTLTTEIVRSLTELELGLSGELTMSERMEKLQDALFLDRVPDNWSKLAYPSLRTLSSWLMNWSLRVAQLRAWCDNPSSVPNVVDISLLFNPQSYLTAIMQTTAQRNNLELDKLAIVTEVTRKTAEEIDSAAREGAYVTGLSLEGCRWNAAAGTLEESLPREMFCPLPVVCCKSIPIEKMEKNGIYQCPVYQTQQRGPTYVFTASLRTKLPAAKWILGGVVCVMDVV